MQTASDSKQSLWNLLSESEHSRELILKQILENGGELSPELEAQLSNVNPDLPAKVDAYRFVMESLDASADLFKLRAKQMASAGSSLEKASNRIRESLKKLMVTKGLEELEGNLVRFKLAKCAKRLVIDSPASVPPAFLVQVSEWVPDKERIKAALENKEVVTGARLEGGVQLREYLNKA